MSDIGKAIGDAMMGFVIVCIVVTAAVTAALIFGIPWLWSLLKPLLHTWTA